MCEIPMTNKEAIKVNIYRIINKSGIWMIPVVISNGITPYFIINTVIKSWRSQNYRNRSIHLWLLCMNSNYWKASSLWYIWYRHHLRWATLVNLKDLHLIAEQETLHIVWSISTSKTFERILTKPSV